MSAPSVNTANRALQRRALRTVERWLPGLCGSLLLLASNGVGAACLGVMNVSAGALNFGAYNPLSGTDKDATSTINVTCNLVAGIGLLPSFTLSLGAGGAGSFSPRKLSAGTPKLNYNLFTDFPRTLIWGDGSPGTVQQSYSALLGLGTIPFTVYGRVFLGQDRAPGTYNDAILVTVEF